MVKVKVIKKDESYSTYNVEYPNAYVNAIILDQNNRGESADVKAIFIEDELAAFRLKVEEELVLVPDRVGCGMRFIDKVKESGRYWVTDTTVGDLSITYTKID